MIPLKGYDAWKTTPPADYWGEPDWDWDPIDDDRAYDERKEREWKWREYDECADPIEDEEGDQR